MKSEIIIHYSVSLDSSLTGFMPDMGLHYKIAGGYNPDAHLIGSETIIKGIDMFGEGVPDDVPGDYITHLKERNYQYIVAGKEKVDLKMAIDHLREKFGITKILTDTGRVLGNLLLNMGMVTETSLLVHPLIVGENCYAMFSDVTVNLNLKLKKSEQFENGCVWMVYSVEKGSV